MRKALTHSVEQEKNRAEFYRQGLAAWEHYRATCLHVTAEEADAWLTKLEAGESAEPPECHD